MVLLPSVTRSLGLVRECAFIVPCRYQVAPSVGYEDPLACLWERQASPPASADASPLLMVITKIWTALLSVVCLFSSSLRTLSGLYRSMNSQESSAQSLLTRKVRAALNPLHNGQAQEQAIEIVRREALVQSFDSLLLCSQSHAVPHPFVPQRNHTNHLRLQLI